MREVAAERDVGERSSGLRSGRAAGVAVLAALAAAAARAARLLRRFLGPQHRLALGIAWRPGSASTRPRGPPAPRPTRRAARGNRRRRESARARAGGTGATPARCSKRGCSDQISLIVASNRRGIEMRSACASSTRSMASYSAGIGLSPRAFAVFHCCRTSCHSSVANRNAGETVLPSRTRASVPASATSMKRGPERLLEDHVEQRQQAVRQPVRAQALQRLRGVAGQQQLLHFVEQARRRHVLRRGSRAWGSAPRSWGRSPGPLSRPAAPRAACAPGPRGSA